MMLWVSRVPLYQGFTKTFLHDPIYHNILADDILQAVVSAMTSLAKDFTGLLLTRFFLGLTEAPYYPGGKFIL